MNAGAEDRLRTEKPAGKWLSCVSLMCQAFSQPLTTSGTPLELLVNPVVQLLQLCLSADASDDERACAAVQVCTFSSMLTLSLSLSLSTLSISISVLTAIFQVNVG